MSKYQSQTVRDDLETDIDEPEKALQINPSAQEASTNRVERDTNAYEASGASSSELLKFAVEKSGKKPIQILRDFLKLNLSRSKMSLREYVENRLFSSGFTQDEKSRFIANSKHWPITHKCCDMTWQAITEDKWLCAKFLENADIPTPKSVAVIDHSLRAFPGAQKIATPDELKAFLKKADRLPIFGKELRGLCGFGAFLIEEAGENELLLRKEGWVSYEEFFELMIGESSFLIQNIEKNHSFFDQFTDHLATIRACVLVSSAGIKIPFCVLKLPSSNNITDSFWRSGNVACGVDVETGVVKTVRTKDRYIIEDHELHPETSAPLLGQTLPYWNELIQLVKKCAPIFSELRYQSMDIAITQDGPLLIEINTGGGFDLPQYATGEGFLTDDVQAFFAENHVPGFS